MKITEASHLDHGLTEEHTAFMLATFGKRDAFFVETVTLPENLAPLTCELYGPIMGDDPIVESDVRYVVRGKRPAASRVVDRPARHTRLLTVIAGPHEGDPCVLYTAFGGKPGEREPWDNMSEADRAKAIEFWKTHALVAPKR